LSVLRRLLGRLRAGRRRRAAAARALDRLFASSEAMRRARLAPRHRSRIVVLELDLAGDGSEGPDRPERLRFGIVRHPKRHPLAPRGDEVLEIHDWWPDEGRIECVGSRNLTRQRE
jgi:hypothetical protein